MPALTPEQRGAFRAGKYVNDYFHFQIELSEQWQPVSSESVASDSAAARGSLNPGKHPTAYLALYLEDRAIRDIVLSIIPVPPDLPKDLDQLTVGMKRIAIAQLTGATDLKEYKEELFLGDPSHRFSAFRVSGTVLGTRTVESAQLTLKDGFLLMFLVSGRSDQDVSEVLRSLNAGLTWTASGP
jgi:hypothetical protein